MSKFSQKSKYIDFHFFLLHIIDSAIEYGFNKISSKWKFLIQNIPDNNPYKSFL